MQQLTGTIQNYEWGDRRFLAELQARPVSGEPEAEWWLGAHPKAPSQLADGRSLADAIAADPTECLGREVAGRFGELPFMAKILAVAQPLSIQSHPSAAQARAGFDRENGHGIPLDSPTRTYRDPNHKPELICALTPFETKCGFRPLEATRELFAALGGGPLAEMAQRLGQPGTDAEVVADILGWLLRSGPERGAELAAATVNAAAQVPRGGPYDAALDWSATLAEVFAGDAGVVVALLMNHVSLEPGQAVFLGPGRLHAHLDGAGVELMANSDNVVRGGFTPKHIDVEELLTVVDCTPGKPPVQTANGSSHYFESPTPEFRLGRHEIGEPTHFTVDGPEILLVTSGEVELQARCGAVPIRTGQAVWIPPAMSHTRHRAAASCTGPPSASPDPRLRGRQS